MSFLPKKVIGIDLHDLSAEIVEIRCIRDKYVLEAYNRILIPSDIIKNGTIKSEQQLQNVLLDLFKNTNPKPIEAKDVAVIFPASKTFTHIFKFPARLKDEEIQKAVYFEAETIIPFSLKDVYWDISIINREQKGKSEQTNVLFAAITKELADQYARVLESIGLNPFLFGINVEALKHALLTQVNPYNLTLIIQFGALSTDYLVLKDKKILYFFSSNECGSKLMEEIAVSLELEKDDIVQKKEEDKLSTLKAPQLRSFLEERYNQGMEIVKLFEKKQETEEIKDVILTGEFLNLPDFYPIAKKYFSRQSINIGDPKTGLDIKIDKFLPLVKERGDKIPYSICFTNAIGIALRAVHKEGKKELNLLPDRLKKRLSSRKYLFWIAFSSVLMSLISLILSGFFLYKHQHLSFERRELEIRKSAVEKTLYGTRYQQVKDNLQKFNNEILALSKTDKNLFSMPDMMEVLYELIPEKIQIKSLQFNAEELKVKITGIAPDRENLLELQETFKQVEFIEEVVSPISNFDQKFQISFNMELKLILKKLPKYAQNTDT